ncbi:type II toxin-antitoxin system HicA family toxin [Fibrella sp. HMF5335]|uniref:Type II toxin-antitoxin system HicA family toxin n=1 Tax=Fibrella rubiginis TaxID=2817060 RepID=A0A939GIW9_9BACT|nr:type II toxin-antitoxin system HicA family toxin [Fibrella rubiginis]
MKQVSGKELCRILEQYGWVLKRINGSHHIFTMAGRPERLSVPVHGNQLLKLGLLKASHRSITCQNHTKNTTYGWL